MQSETDNLRIRKEKLESELQHIQSKLESRIDDIRDDVTARVSPVYWIKKYPLRAIGVAVVAGFLVSRAGRTLKDDGVRSSGGDTFGSLLASELKRVATQRAVGYLVNSLEKQFEKDN
jgi:hypothetical protein